MQSSESQYENERTYTEIAQTSHGLILTEERRDSVPKLEEERKSFA